MSPFRYDRVAMDIGGMGYLGRMDRVFGRFSSCPGILPGLFCRLAGCSGSGLDYHPVVRCVLDHCTNVYWDK